MRLRLTRRRSELELDLTPGDFFPVALDHESWVVGYRPCEVLYFDDVEELLDRLRTGKGDVPQPLIET